MQKSAQDKYSFPEGTVKNNFCTKRSSVGLRHLQYRLYLVCREALKPVRREPWVPSSRHTLVQRLMCQEPLDPTWIPGKQKQKVAMRVSRTKENQLQHCSIKLANGANYRTFKLPEVFVTFAFLDHIHGRHKREEHYLDSQLRKKFQFIMAGNA